MNRTRPAGPKADFEVVEISQEQYERIEATILWARYAWLKSASLLRHAQEKATNKEAAGTGASIGTNSQDQETTAAPT
jgi:hypothetical protein